MMNLQGGGRHGRLITKKRDMSTMVAETDGDDPLRRFHDAQTHTLEIKRKWDTESPFRQHRLVSQTVSIRKPELCHQRRLCQDSAPRR